MIDIEKSSIDEFIEIIQGPQIEYSFAENLKKAKLKPRMKKIFGNYILENELSIIGAVTNAGKSILSYNLANGIANGTEILGLENEIGASKVLLLDFELSDSMTRLRFDDDFIPNENWLKPNLDDLTDLIIGKSISEFIENQIEITNPKVVIIDNLSAIATKPLTDSEYITKIVKDLRDIKNKFNLTIILIHHQTKQLLTSQPLNIYQIAGAGNLMNLVDSIIMLGYNTKVANQRYIYHAKGRNAQKYEKVMVIEIVEKPYFHFEFVSWNDEKSMLTLNSNDSKTNKLKDIAIDIVGTGITYNDFCENYSKKYNQTVSNAKKIIKKLEFENLIIKNPFNHKQYILNNDEMETEPF